MEFLLSPLIFSAIFIAFIHTILGPDHYLPFVALSKANHWSYKKTTAITTVCGLAHCLSSVGIGIFGIGLGIGIGKVEVFEGVRGDVASYLMIAFGLVYLTWSIKRLLRNQEHTHSHGFGRRTYFHKHVSVEDHEHLHHTKTNNLFWGMFIVFLFGPCEPLIPLLMYPAAKANVASCVPVSLIFTVVTVLTMITCVSFSLKGISFIRFSRIERYSHALASLTIIVCGILIILGL